MTRSRVVVILALAIAAVGAALYQASGRTPDGPVTRVRYSLGGGMMGGFSSRELVLNPDGSATYTTTSQAWHGDRETTRVYDVDPAAFDRARDVIVERRLVRASKRPMSDLVVYDADSWTLSFEIGGETFVLREFQELGRDDREGVDELLEVMSAAADSGTLLSEELSPRKVALSTAEGYTYTFDVNDSQAATDLIEQLPQDVSFELRGDEVVIALPVPLDVGDAPPVTACEAGTLAYRVSTGELVIACDVLEAEDGLYELGATEAYLLQGLVERGAGEGSLWSLNSDY